MAQYHPSYCPSHPCKTDQYKILIGFIVGNIQDRMIEGKKLCDNPSNPRRDMYPKLFELTIEKGTCFTTVFSAIRVTRDFICTISFSDRSILEQPERMRVLKDFNIYIPTGRFLRLVQPLDKDRRNLSCLKAFSQAISE